MRGEDKAEPGAPRQSAHVLAAWVRDQLADVGRSQVARIDELRGRLQADGFRCDNSQLAQAILAMNSAARQLQFQHLRQGWLARLLGRRRAARAHFMAAFDRIAGCASEIKTHLERESPRQLEHISSGRRIMLELDMELQSLHTWVDQGVNWLQDMCSQLAEARTQRRDEPQHSSLAEAAQRYTLEFKRLESVATLTRDVALRASTILARRSALLEQSHKDVETFEKTWVPRLSQLVAAMRIGERATPHIPKAIEAHDELKRRFSASADACGALQQEEHLLAEQLVLLQRHIAGDVPLED